MGSTFIQQPQYYPPGYPPQYPNYPLQYQLPPQYQEPMGMAQSYHEKKQRIIKDNIVLAKKDKSRRYQEYENILS